MALLIVVVWPISKILDLLFGEKKSYEPDEFKHLLETYVSNQEKEKEKELIYTEDTVIETTHLVPDEVSVIIGALNMEDKTCGDVMITIDNVYMLSDDTIFTPELMEEIIEYGHSRIPVFHGKRNMIIGMLLTIQLIRLNPEKLGSIEDLELVEIPHVTSTMSLFKILAQFKTGKSQMAVVLDANDHITPVGILTLEDVFATLIGDKIYDETDRKRAEKKKKEEMIANEIISHREGQYLFRSYSAIKRNTEETLLRRPPFSPQLTSKHEKKITK